MKSNHHQLICNQMHYHYATKPYVFLFIKITLIIIRKVILNFQIIINDFKHKKIHTSEFSLLLSLYFNSSSDQLSVPSPKFPTILLNPLSSYRPHPLGFYSQPYYILLYPL